MSVQSKDGDLAVRWTSAERVLRIEADRIAEGNSKGPPAVGKQTSLLPTVAAMVHGVVCHCSGTVLPG